VTLYVDPEAEAALLGLYRDPQQKVLAERIEKALDELEADPTAANVRRHRFKSWPPPAMLWCFFVKDHDGEWAILWSGPDAAGDVDVRYIGSASFLP
jgi:hypothetical protein